MSLLLDHVTDVGQRGKKKFLMYQSTVFNRVNPVPTSLQWLLVKFPSFFEHDETPARENAPSILCNAAGSQLFYDIISVNYKL